MTLSDAQCYQAVLTRDARFDGRFFVAVRTTRIYCRPICRVRTPMERNCTFFAHAAAAEGAGYRPCKRCRPELAPGHSPMDAGGQLARRAAQHIGQDFLADHSLGDLADRLGVTDRQVRRAFQQEFGVSPVAFWQTQRLLLAKQLLTDSKMPVTLVAYASGFRSLRRFNALLKARYRLTPTDLRKTQGKIAPGSFSAFAFRLSYRPPLDWDRLLAFLAHRAIPHVEAVDAGAYRRTVRLDRHGQLVVGDIRVTCEPARHMLSVRLSDTLLPVCAAVLERTRRLFDLHADPAVIDATLGPLAGASPGLRVPGSFDPFETAVRAVLGQQVSVAAARTLAGRLADAFGEPIPNATGELTRLFPTPQRIASTTVEQVMQLGLTTKRAETLIGLASAIATGRVLLEPGHRVEETMAALRQLPGVGEWTAQYIAMRGLSWPDAFPHTDLGICRALGETNPKRILATAEQWRPWRAYAALHLWASLA